MNSQKVNVLFDMETADPDDAMTLCLLANHSSVNLRAVTVTPGTNEQVGLIRRILRECELDIPVGACHVGYDKNCVSGFHHKWLNNIAEEQPDAVGFEVIENAIKAYPDLVVLTGAPLKNFALIAEKIKLKKWVAQGGFAGDNIIRPELRLPKFDGMITCPTFNFNGAPIAAEQMLASKTIEERRLVSKNVCHGMVYDLSMHEEFAPHKEKSAGLKLAYEGMSVYLERRPTGKKFHDPLALAVLLDTSVCTFAEVEMYRKRGGWGANLMPGSNTFIATSASRQRMVEVLTDNM